MARVIVGGQSLPTKVIYVGNAMQVWVINEIPHLFIGPHNIAVTEPEASELLADIANVSGPELESKWLAIAQQFLSSIGQ